MKVGLYFGSFNPVHIGHLIIAEHVYNNTDLDQVWFVVSPQNPFKTKNSLLNSYDRLHLVQIAVDNNDYLKASDAEFKLPSPSYTIDTLTYLHEKYPTTIFSIVMGSDGYQNLKNWKNYEQLVDKYTFIVYKRPGFDVEEKNEVKIVVLDNAPLLEISATFIRKSLEEGKSVRYLLPEPVYKEIEAQNFFKQKLKNKP